MNTHTHTHARTRKITYLAIDEIHHHSPFGHHHLVRVQSSVATKHGTNQIRSNGLVTFIKYLPCHTECKRLTSTTSVHGYIYLLVNMSDTVSFFKQAAIQIGSGGSAGFIEVCIMHPLDLVKTRLQLQGSRPITVNDPRYYRGIWDCFVKMRRNEGVFSYWKGILPPILVETPKRAVKFFTFEQYKQFFMFGSPTATPLTFALAGLGAGITESILVNPFEVVKVTLQSNAARSKDVPSTWSVTRQIIVSEGLGLRGINKGLFATIARNGVYNMIYFGNYHTLKGALPTYEDPVKEFFRKLAIGFSSGIMGSLANLPFDVAKSRIQGPQPIPGQVKYRTTTGAIMIIYREEGWRALYKGLLPKLLRLGPGGAIMLVVYDYMHEYLMERFCT